MKLNKIFTTMKPSFEFGSALTVISAIITDVLAPLSSLGAWVTASFFVIGVVLIIKGFFFPNLWKANDGHLSHLLNFPLAFCFFMATAITGYQYGVYQEPEYQNGYLASKVAIVESLQELTGISKQMLAVQEEQLAFQKADLALQEQQLAAQKSGVTVQKELLSIQSSGIKIQEEQLTEQREGAQKLGRVSADVADLSMSLYMLGDALNQGNIQYLRKWEESGRSLGDVYKRQNAMFPPLLLSAIEINMEIEHVLHFLAERGALKPNELFDASPTYINCLRVIWEKTNLNSSRLDDLALKSESYPEFLASALENFGIELSGVEEQEYLDVKSKKEFSLSAYGNVQRSRISQLTLAKAAGNEGAVKFLMEYKTPSKKEYIMVKGNKIRLDGKYLNLHL